MFRNNMFAGTPTFKIFLGLGLCTLGGAMMFIYFNSREEDEQSSSVDVPESKRKPEINKKKAPKIIKVKLDIANDKIPLIIGRGSSNINTIETNTNTKIEFREKNNKYQICEISGIATDVEMARKLLLKSMDTKILEEEMLIPHSACKKIVGNFGGTLLEINRTSNAKVTLDSGGGHRTDADKRLITITGTQKQINIARKLIEEKLEEDKADRKAVEETEQQREPRRSPSNSVSSSMYSSQTSLSSHIPPKEKMLAAKVDEKPMEVYVSAVATPSKFWVQIVGPQSKKLDDLVNAMYEYYNIEENRNFHQIRDPYVGQIVAAIFKYDGKWYRAEIVGILPNEFNDNEVVLDLYFVDYGDSQYVQATEIFELRTDFLTLRFQAVECFLANIKSTNTATDLWPMQSIQKFEELAHVAQWKKLTARVVTYKEKPKTAIGDSQNLTSTMREGSPIPGVELYDIIDGIEYNINHALIAQGYALPLDEMLQPLRSLTSSPEMLTYGSNLSRSNSHSQSHSPTPTNENTKVSLTTTEDKVLSDQLNHLNKHSSHGVSKPYSKRAQIKALANMNGVDISEL